MRATCPTCESPDREARYYVTHDEWLCEDAWHDSTDLRDALAALAEARAEVEHLRSDVKGYRAGLRANLAERDAANARADGLAEKIAVLRADIAAEVLAAKVRAWDEGAFWSRANDLDALVKTSNPYRALSTAKEATT